ncbi:Acetyltransferase (GNAT) family [Musa troglodytarum]|uniref:Acetyltransferase (GNAT) family n=1 Tax=Musa troglodytarum TaxID=320322 RepID=A0A9E7HKF0_9LILI|nr:Acetyltransferase (GNAT) family [Musa troglodytarum]
MGCPPTPLPLSLECTLRPFLFSSSPRHSSPSSTAFFSNTSTLSLHKSRALPLLKLLRRFSSPSAPQPVTPSLLDSSPWPGAFLGPDGLQVLRDFRVTVELDHGGGGGSGGFLEIRPMLAEELDATAQLLAESFAESVLVPARYVPLLAFLVKQYVAERRCLEPHVTVLVGFYRERGTEGAAQLACTAEISFDARGANAAPPSPVPPGECPYICNMAVRKALRRRRIGWHLLRACEELMTRMKTERNVYLHCRVIDKVPFDMYQKAGYKVVKTDGFLVWLTLQRRKHLMSKELPHEIG